MFNMEQNISEDGRTMEVAIEDATEVEVTLAVFSLAILASLSRARHEGLLSLEQVKTIYDRTFDLAPKIDQGYTYNAETGEFNDKPVAYDGE